MTDQQVAKHAAAGRDAAEFDLAEGWVTPEMGTTIEICKAAHARSPQPAAYWFAYQRALLDAGYPLETA